MGLLHDILRRFAGNDAQLRLDIDKLEKEDQAKAGEVVKDAETNAADAALETASEATGSPAGIGKEDSSA